jgi:histidinol-phosphatase (PHP family)
MCRQAITLGMRQVAFTEHVDFVPADAGYGFFRPAAYLAEVSRCRQLFGDQLAILAGVEIGEFHRFRSQANALLDAHRFDLVIGSLHWVKQGCVTATPNPQPQPMDRAFQDYFDELQQMCSVGGFDIVGHLDVVKRNGFDTAGQYNVLDHERAIRSPGQAVMTWYRQMGGRLLTIGSDAHTPAGLAAGWETAVGMARAAGFTHLTSFSNRTPCALSLDGKW